MLMNRSSRYTWLLIVILCIGVPLTQTHNILAIFSYAVKSPYLVVRPLIMALVERGHQVTVISSLKYFPSINGAHHIRIVKLDQLLDEVIDTEIHLPSNKWSEASWVAYFYYYSSNYILSDSKVQHLLNNAKTQFDLIIVDTPLSDALCGFAKHFNAPLVGIAAYGSAWIVDYLAGNSAPSVYDPISPLGYAFERIKLLDKWFNWIYLTEEWLLERLVYLPPQIKLYRQYFNDSHSNFNEIRRNFSLILVNQHFSLGRVRSNVPNIIEVAGMHMCMEKDCKLDPMPEDLQKFIDEAEHGVIYFSMGIQILVKWLPKHLKQTLFDTFSKLKQRVVWKSDEWESLINKSDNIYVKSFLPQQQILSHPKTKLFITHCGLLSIIEAVYYGVPILSLPLYYEQFANAQRMRLAGMGQTLDINSMNVEMLNRSIQDLIQDPSYGKTAQKMSTRFRDQPMSPFQTAVWWIEYILRHKGAPHMRLAEEEMSFMQYYNIDIVSILFSRIGITAIIVILMGCKLINFVLNYSQFNLGIHLVR